MGIHSSIQSKTKLAEYEIASAAASISITFHFLQAARLQMSNTELLGWSTAEHQQKKLCHDTTAKALGVLPLAWGCSQPLPAASTTP